MTKRILIVDDDLAVRQSLAAVLRMERYTVLTAANGVEALGICRNTRIGVVLLDLNLPHENGWDTFVQLTNNNPALAVIVITARPNQFFTSLASGAGALMEKPLDFSQLLLTIRELLDEPPDVRIARIAGRTAEFHYYPSAHSSRPAFRHSLHTDHRTNQGVHPRHATAHHAIAAEHQDIQVP